MDPKNIKMIKTKKNTTGEKDSKGTGTDRNMYGSDKVSEKRPADAGSQSAYNWEMVSNPTVRRSSLARTPPKDRKMSSGSIAGDLLDTLSMELENKEAGQVDDWQDKKANPVEGGLLPQRTLPNMESDLKNGTTALGTGESTNTLKDDAKNSPGQGNEMETETTGEGNTTSSVTITDWKEESVLKNPKRKRMESPLQNEAVEERANNSDALEDISNVMAKVLKKSKELKKSIKRSTKTKLEIRQVARELDQLINALHNKFKMHKTSSPPENKEIAEDKEKTVTRSVGVQATVEDIEYEKQKVKDDIRQQITLSMDTGTGFQNICGILDAEWPEDMYKTTQVEVLNSKSFNLDGDYAVLLDLTEPKRDRAIENLSIKYPEMEALIQTNDGQIDYLINTVSTRVRNQEISEKTTAIYVLPLESDKAGFDNVEDTYEKIKALKETMEVHPTDNLNLILNERLNLNYMRKIIEHVFYSTSLKIRLMTAESRPKTQMEKQSRPQVGKVVVKRGDSTYAELLKSVKSKVDIAKVGVQVKTIRKTAKGDLLLEVQGGMQKADRLKEAIKKDVGKDVKITNNEVTIHIYDIDATTSQEEVEEAVVREVGHGEAHTVKVKSMRPSWDGNQIATVLASKFIANRMILAKVIRIGWVNCRVRERVTVPRCFNCLEFGHRASECKGPDRSNACLNCYQTDHKAKECKNTHYCLACKTNEHRSDTTRCPRFRQLIRENTIPRKLDSRKEPNNKKADSKKEGNRKESND